MFKIIPNTENKYEANELGEIKRVHSYVSNNLNNGKRVVGLKPLKPKTKSNGYKEVSLSLDSGGKSFYVHRLVASTFIGEIPKGYEVNHIDGNKANNTLENLEIVSASENSKHSYHVLNNKIKPRKGSSHHNAKLTELDVINIRNMHSKFGLNYVKEKFSQVNKFTMMKIIYRNTWKHI